MRLPKWSIRDLIAGYRIVKEVKERIYIYKEPIIICYSIYNHGLPVTITYYLIKRLT